MGVVKRVKRDQLVLLVATAKVAVAAAAAAARMTPQVRKELMVVAVRRTKGGRRK